MYEGYVGLQVKDERGATDECIARVIIKNAVASPITGDVDQSQEKADDFVKIYGDKKYAQSFKPGMIGFEGFDILIERKGIASYESNSRMGNALHRIGKILSRFFGIGKGSMVSALTTRIKTSKSSSNAGVTSFFVGDLVVGLYSSLDYSGKIMEKVFSAQDISRSRSWIHIDFETELDPRETYYIVVYQTGGSEWQYYKWYYGSGDPYDRGSSYNYEGGWNEDTSKDFCFKTYGHKTGDEPDGIEERWAVIFGCVDTFMGIGYCEDQDAYDLRDALVSHGWDPSHIKVLISPTFDDVKNAMEWLASVDDMDDIDLAAWTSHGGKHGFAAKDRGVDYCHHMGPWLDNCGAKGIFVIVDTCGSSGAIQFLAKQGRVIMTSCAEDESSWAPSLLRNSIFFYFLTEPYNDKYPRDGKPDGALNQKSMDKDDNGWVSAEEAYQYVCESTSEFIKKHGDYEKYPQHPQLYDGYAGDLDVTRFD